jgi:cytochrome c-type biogenesis protein CcsB
MRLAVVLLSIFAIAIGVATFIENDFGTETAQVEIYRARWFEILLLLGTLNLIAIGFKYKMYLFKKWYVSLFHLSFVVVMVGAFLTRYAGFEGTMHIREGEKVDYILSEKSYLNIEVDGEKFSTPMQFSNLFENSFSEKIGGLEISLKEFIPYVKKEKFENSNGKSVLSGVVSVDENLPPIEVTISEGEVLDLGFTVLDFKGDYVSKTPHHQDVIQISKEGSSIKIKSLSTITAFSMADKNESVRGKETEVERKYLYRVANISIVFKDISLGSETRLVSQMSKPKTERERYPNLMIFQIGDQTLDVYGMSGAVGEKFSTEVSGKMVSISYGAEELALAFSIYLRDFQLERYPGSMSPASYASEVAVFDENSSFEYRIFMNNVLDYRGYRFFQASYDTDEKGTILSVNFDPGTSITYIGYGMMFLGLFITLFGRKSRFQKLRKELLPALLLFLPLLGHSEKIEIEQIDTIFKFDKVHADKFGSLLVQDQSGRMKPLDSLNLEVLRKVYRGNSIEGLNHNQIILGMVTKPHLWKQINMIYTNDPKVNEILGFPKDTKRVPFEVFFEDVEMLDGYKLADEVSKALQTPPKKRGLFEKNILKIDERVNVAYMVYSGELLKIYPYPENENNRWVSTIEALTSFPPKDAEMVRAISVIYFTALDKALKSGDWNETEKGLEFISQFQQGHGSDVLIDDSKIMAEIYYNRYNIFQNLIAPTLILGVLLLILAFWELLSEKRSKAVSGILKSGVYIVFLLFTTGLILRWYISGHAPWSDAYESLVYIGWSTLLAGLLFSRTSPFILSATAILSGIILFVANLSWLDPQITNLIPVLSSYWLTIHVSIITASYGFLGLGALLGFITLLLFAIHTESNRNRISKKILNLNRVNEMNLIVGLVMLTVGNFLGGVWANESWGRYWGWDPKETWALVTILVYTVVLHIRFIPKANSPYLFALISLLSFSSVLMTYFVVNFYLSGMHSYAQGDPVPVPEFVYWTLGVITIISLLAWRKRKIS